MGAMCRGGEAVAGARSAGCGGLCNGHGALALGRALLLLPPPMVGILDPSARVLQTLKPDSEIVYL